MARGVGPGAAKSSRDVSIRGFIAVDQGEVNQCFDNRVQASMKGVTNALM